MRKIESTGDFEGWLDFSKIKDKETEKREREKK